MDDIVKGIVKIHFILMDKEDDELLALESSIIDRQEFNKLFSCSNWLDKFRKNFEDCCYDVCLSFIKNEKLRRNLK